MAQFQVYERDGKSADLGIFYIEISLSSNTGDKNVVETKILPMFCPIKKKYQYILDIQGPDIVSAPILFKSL